MYAIRSYYDDVKFINKYGVNQVITFRKEKTESISITRESFEASARITSYNVCYTKLLRCTSCAGAARETLDMIIKLDLVYANNVDDKKNKAKTTKVKPE